MKKKWSSILYTANNFSSCVDFLYGFMSRFEKGHTVNRTITTPLIVNAAFAAELYLKAIIAFENNDDKNKHDLLDLFELLTIESQERIIKNSIEKKLIENSNDFIKLMQTNKNAFVEFRYVYEFKAGQHEKLANYVFLVDLGKVLYEYIQSIIPENRKFEYKDKI